jgi:hypothetical protein
MAGLAAAAAAAAAIFDDIIAAAWLWCMETLCRQQG